MSKTSWTEAEFYRLGYTDSEREKLEKECLDAAKAVEDAHQRLDAVQEKLGADYRRPVTTAERVAVCNKLIRSTDWDKTLSESGIECDASPDEIDFDGLPKA